MQVEESKLFEGEVDPKERAEEYWMLIQVILKDVLRILPFENLRNDDERRKFILCSQSKIVGVTVDYLLRNYQKMAS